MKIGDVEVFTIAEAAERLGLSRQTLSEQVRRGVLPAIKTGRQYLVTIDEIERYRTERRGRHGFANPAHPLHGKQGPGHRRKKSN